MSITAENLVWKAGGKTIVDGVSFSVQPGRLLGLIGPNGCGKTSLLRLLAGLRQPHSGHVALDGRDIRSIGRRAMARRMAFVEQHATTNANLQVIDVVKLGRYPHRSMFSGWAPSDDDAVEAALDRAGMAQKRLERWQNLSGGERQRAQIARALAQTPRELLLDEPTNHLDVQHQIGLMRLVSNLPITGIIALHDLNHAAMFCDELLVMQAGRIVCTGAPEAVLTHDLLKTVFSVEAIVEISPHHRRPHIHFLP